MPTAYPSRRSNPAAATMTFDHAFDVMAMDDEVARQQPLSMRKALLDRLLSKQADGIFVVTFEQGEAGPALFSAAISMGSEGLVSKRRNRA